MKGSPSDYLYDSEEACCKTWFSWKDDCVTSSETVSSDLVYYPSWVDNTCYRKQAHELKYWETDTFTTLEECCSRRFGWNIVACCDTPDMGGCTIDVSGTAVYTPDWTARSCTPRNENLLEPWEKTFLSSSTDQCCTRFFSWEKKDCCTRSGGC